MAIFHQIPNILTILRILIIPIIIITFYFDDKVFAHRLASGLFLFAGITDFFDGFIARKFNISTKLGKMLDNIADKLLVSSIVVMFIKFRKVSEIPCLLILSRELIIAGLREFLALVKVSVPVSYLAKIKTTTQMTSLFLLILGTKGSGIPYLDLIGKITLWIAAILTLITGYSYLKASISYLFNK